MIISKHRELITKAYAKEKAGAYINKFLRSHKNNIDGLMYFRSKMYLMIVISIEILSLNSSCLV